jgi:Protein of unknown function (DUF3443)
MSSSTVSDWVRNPKGLGFLALFVILAVSHAPKAQAMGCGTESDIGRGNVTPMVVDGFPCKAGGKAGANNAPQTPFISIKICSPDNPSNCQIIDHIEVDTGSSGLRIAYDALSPALRSGKRQLPLVSTGGSILTECETYVSSFAYGPIVRADVFIAGEKATDSKIQIFGHPRYTVPRDCRQQGGADLHTPQTFGANGLIGVSFEELDDFALYYNCQSNTTQCVRNSKFLGIPNTVTQFAKNNNGVVLSLPALTTPDSLDPVEGTLTFGISTQNNNTPGINTLTLINDGTTSDRSGTFDAKVGSTWYMGYIDSGTDTIYFFDDLDPALKPCPASGWYAGFYCPTKPQNLVFNLADTGTRKTKGAFNYTVANASIALASSPFAYTNIGGISSSSSNLDNAMAFGLSVFFGNNMYFLFNNQKASSFGPSTSPTTGPMIGIEQQ